MNAITLLQILVQALTYIRLHKTHRRLRLGVVQPL